MFKPRNSCRNCLFLLITLAILILSVERSLATAKPQVYEVQPGKNLTYLEVSTCFSTDPPSHLYANGQLAPEALQWMHYQQKDMQQELVANGRSIDLTAITSGDCLSYRVNLEGLSAWHRWQGHGVADDVILTNPDDWLWLPHDNNANIVIRFKLPPDMEVSVPWQSVSGKHDSQAYSFERRNPDWDSRVAIGRISRFDLTQTPTPLRVAVLSGEPVVNIDAIRDWISSGIQALDTLHADQSPLPPVQVLVIPVDHADEPVPWAEVQRGGGDAIHLYIDQNREPAAFINDWTLVHELGHLLHPRLPQADAWLYEGLASYYQNVLRARAGLLTPLTAWRKLQAGFQRGMDETDNRQQLTRVAEAMHRNHRYMRIYWSGAAYFLEVDTRLRQISDGRQTLDSVLARFRECCLPAKRRWHGEAFVRRLDALSGNTIFSETYQHYRRLRHFPPTDGLYRELGVSARNGQLELNERAPLAQLRRQIMAASSGTKR